MLLPVGLLPLPVNPSLHSQVYELMPSLHFVYLPQWLEIHSSMSEKYIFTL